MLLLQGLTTVSKLLFLFNNFIFFQQTLANQDTRMDCSTSAKADANANANENENENEVGNEIPKTEPILMIEWREFSLDPSRGEFKVNGNTIWIEQVPNSGQGTGLNVWDGSIVLSKYLEHSGEVKDSNVLELGAGCGIVGLACAALHAKNVIMTDLDYCIGNIEFNIQNNTAIVEKSDSVTAFELDWFKGKSDKRIQNLDYIVAADVIWIPELVEPFVDTLKAISFEQKSTLKGIYIAHQTRALKTDSLLFEALEKAGFVLETLDESRFHPQFVSKKVKIFKLIFTP